MEAPRGPLATPGAPPILKLLANDIRWRVVAALALSDYRVQELVSLVGEPANLVSYHLRQLRAVQLVGEHRSTADGRDVYYSLDLVTLHRLYTDAGRALHPLFPTAPGMAPSASDTGMLRHTVQAPLRVLLLCTHNSARSQMAEAIFRHLGGAEVDAVSAGSDPTSVHPDAVTTLAHLHIDMQGASAKPLDDFLAQRFDCVITLCDHVREVCPHFSGEPHYLHWSYPDPTLVSEEDGARARAFAEIAERFVLRVQYILPILTRPRHDAA